ncbi:YceI family protein [Pseudooctadecabacter jejudonensis]|uniref:Lipid/polyisoprenoid-binding YceI-like domain-containing protein n=1 Tax=Pseudooctadecabacter jejudonensis TaxID=1391910 RepID=A0A1Y5T4F5_9RHOB|nr:YceI family protein [Pseudooctadecabacter jejudonensis]SLN53938.1 hypothetical protein PSJ8397_02812 [Pseudooctadecabacter jejudonensis]
MKPTLISATLALLLAASGATAQTWTLDAEASRLAFGSVKNAYIGETHTFEGLSGTVSRDGAVAIDIPLSGVATNIDIRNERMIEYVFANAPRAKLTADLDMDEISSMRPGETMTMELDANLAFLDNDVPVFTEVFVARLSPRSVMVTTNDMLFLATDELGIDSGIDALQELASLDSITRSTPVTVRLMFER